jgi:hypothetical protein
MTAKVCILGQLHNPILETGIQGQNAGSEKETAQDSR